MKRLLLLLLLPIFLYSENISNNEINNYSREFLSDLDNFLKLRDIENNLDFLLDIKNSKEEYQNTLSQMGIPQRDDYILIKYSNNSNKIITYKSDNFNYNSLKHYLTLQYIENYGSKTPFWFSNGIANYSEGYNKEIGFIRDIKWMDILKLDKNISNIFTTLSNSTTKDNISAKSWVLIDFLLNSGSDSYKRVFWDSLSAAKYLPDDQSTTAIQNLFKINSLNNDLKEYILSSKSYKEYMDNGVELYMNNKYSDSLKMFEESIKLEPENYSPYYYKGLALNKIKEYNKAYSSFSLALDKGAPKDVVYYSIGVNFYSTEKYTEAEKYLTKIKDKMYATMAEKLLNEIKKH